MARTKKIPEPIQIPEPLRFETEIFTHRSRACSYVNNLSGDKPTVANGDVSFQRWKYTVELIEEPKEVLAERLQQLWDHAQNYHHWKPLRLAAATIGYELQGSPGTKTSGKEAPCPQKNN